MQVKKALLVLLGANGQLGRSFRQYFLTQSDENIDLYSVTRKECDFEKKEDVDRLFSQLDATIQSKSYTACILINTVAYTQVDQAELDEKRAMQLNAHLVGRLAQEVSKREWGLIHISTDYVFDGEKSLPYEPEDLPHPLSVYGKSKYEGELSLLSNTSFGKALIIRTSWLYSPYGKNFLKTILRLAHTQREIKVVADQYGAPTYAPHLAEYIMLSCDKFLKFGSFHSTIEHFCDQGKTSWYDFAKEIISEASLEKECKVIPIATVDYPTLASRPPHSLLAVRSDISPKYPWQTGVKKCIQEISSMRDI